MTYVRTQNVTTTETVSVIEPNFAPCGGIGPTITTTGSNLTTTTTVTASTGALPRLAVGGLPTQIRVSITPQISIDTSSDASATNSSSERKVLSAAGRIWIFFTDGCNVVFQSSPDSGTTWSPPVVAQTDIARGWFFTVGQVGDMVDLVSAASNGALGGAILLRTGTMNSNGSIGWSPTQPQIPFNVGDGTVPTVAVDSNGNVWIALEAPSGNGRSVLVFMSAGGNWSQVLDIGNLADYPRPILLPLTEGKMALEVLTETPGERRAVIYTTANGGASWSSPIATSPDNILTLSSVSVGNTVYSVTTDPSGNVYIWNFTYGGASSEGPTLVANCCSGQAANDAVISSDGASDLFVAYADSSGVMYQTSSDLGVTWSAVGDLTLNENYIQPGSLAVNALTTGLEGVFWTSQNVDSSGLYLVRFASVTLLA